MTVFLVAPKTYMRSSKMLSGETDPLLTVGYREAPSVLLRTPEPYRKRPIVGPTAAPTPRKENRSINPPPLLRPMSDPKHPEKREEPSGATLSVEEWIELMNKHDPLEQYAKKRKEKQRAERDCDYM